MEIQNLLRCVSQLTASVVYQNYDENEFLENIKTKIALNEKNATNEKIGEKKSDKIAFSEINISHI